MIRTQIQFEPEVYLRIKKAAARDQCSISEIVRRSIRRQLEMADTASRWKGSLKVVGRHRSGLGDLAAKHDSYLKDEW